MLTHVAYLTFKKMNIDRLNLNQSYLNSSHFISRNSVKRVEKRVLLRQIYIINILKIWIYNDISGIMLYIDRLTLSRQGNLVNIFFISKIRNRI